MKQILALFACMIMLHYAYAQAPQPHTSLLTKKYSQADVTAALRMNTDWVSLPGYADRAFWDKLPASVRQELIKNGESALDFSWGVAKATDFMEFTRSGNRDIMQMPNQARKNNLQKLALAELAEGKGRFTDQIINGVWAICEQSTWVLSAHLPRTSGTDLLPDVTQPFLDLGAGDAGALISWVHHFFRPSLDKVNPLISARMRLEVKNRILTPYYTRNDFWWQGFNERAQNNWNPWINYNMMQCILLMEEDPKLRAENIYKAMKSIDRFTDWYLPDGACDEGPSYWSHAGGKYFECLELLHKATKGKIDVYATPLVRKMGRYICDVYINDPWFVNFADAGAKGSIYEGLVYRYGKAVNDTVMMGFGAFYAQKEKLNEKPTHGTIENVITGLQTINEIMAYPGREPLLDHAWYPDNQVAIAREKPGKQDGFYFAAKGGHNAESHNHNDVGTFILYYNGLPCLIDAGVGTYVRQTFSPERYKIWTMQSAWHNLPLINGVQQQAGREFKSNGAAFKSTAKQINFTTDIATAYPADAKVTSWKRGYTLNRGSNFVITDDYQLQSFVSPQELHFITPCKVDTSVPGKIKLTGEGFTLTMAYDAKQYNVSTDHNDIKDPRLLRSWPEGLERITLTGKNTTTKGSSKLTISK